MKKALLILFLLIVIFFTNYDFGEKYKGDRDNYVYTEKACNLFIEYYLVYSPKGWGVDYSLYGIYLTDSLSFRIYLSESENISFNRYMCQNDSIFFIIYKNNIYSELNKKYDIKRLRKLNNLNEFSD